MRDEGSVGSRQSDLTEQDMSNGKFGPKKSKRGYSIHRFLSLHRRDIFYDGMQLWYVLVMVVVCFH